MQGSLHGAWWKAKIGAPAADPRIGGSPSGRRGFHALASVFPEWFKEKALT